MSRGTAGADEVTGGALGSGLGEAELGVTSGEGGASPESVSGGGVSSLGLGSGAAVGLLLGPGSGCGAGPPASGMSSPPSLRSRNSLRATFQFSSR